MEQAYFYWEWSLASGRYSMVRRITNAYYIGQKNNMQLSDLNQISASGAIRSSNLANFLNYEVTIQGLLIAKREFKKHAFLVISDRDGSIQVVVEIEQHTVLPDIGMFVCATGI